MKTDIDRTKDFLDSLRIKYGFGIDDKSQVETINGIKQITVKKSIHTVTFGKYDYPDSGYPECDKVSGYNGFYTRFEFDENGKFLTVGVWE